MERESREKLIKLAIFQMQVVEWLHLEAKKVTAEMKSFENDETFNEFDERYIELQQNFDYLLKKVLFERLEIKRLKEKLSKST